MDTDDLPTTVGVWIGEDDETMIAEFDQVFLGESRSEKIKDAMKLYASVEQTLKEIEYDGMSERDKRMWLKSIMRDAAAEDAVESQS